MGDGADFASYMVARWPAVVRTLVLLGSPPDEADGSHLTPAEWRRLLQDGDAVLLDNRNHFEVRLGLY